MQKIIVSLGRLIKSGFINFKRNGLLSAATISILSLNLLILGGLIIFSVATEVLVKNLEEKIDISVYFNADVPEDQVSAIQKSLEGMPEIKSVEYVSKETALERFKEKHKGDEVILESLAELDINPLESSLNIKARAQNDYEKIIEELENPDFKELIDNVNYYENQKVIEQLSNIIRDARQSRLVLSLILSLISILIVFITIKLAINTSREEIAIMRLVGATNWSIRGPFLVEGIIYGVISALASIIIIYIVMEYNLTSYLFGSTIFNYYAEINLFYYFKTRIFEIFLLLSGFGIVLSTISSIIAIRKYLNV